MLQAFCLPPFQYADQERHNLLCPVWAIDAYVHRAALWRKNEQLFVCFGPPNKGYPASKQRMSKWVVEAISLAYESAGQPSSRAVRSHSTRSMAASKALISGVALQEVCDVAGWSSHSSDFILWTWKRERTLLPQPYILRACKRLAQTFKLVTASTYHAKCSPSISDATSVPSSGNRGYSHNRTFSLPNKVAR